MKNNEMNTETGMENAVVLLDSHTHHPAPQPEGVICISPSDAEIEECQFYSCGIHPWTLIEAPGEEVWENLEKRCSSPSVIAVGEAGLDPLRGGPLFRQMQVFQRQVELSEKLGKPLVIHNVRSQDTIIGLRRDLNPTQQWMIHGFRGNPNVARMFLDAGLWLSFGERFNVESLRYVPTDRILAETDESPLTIRDIITSLSRELTVDIFPVIARNTRLFFGLG